MAYNLSAKQCMPQGICFPYFIFTYYSPIAQLVERLAVNQDVTGSSPVGRVYGLSP